MTTEHKSDDKHRQGKSDAPSTMPHVGPDVEDGPIPGRPETFPNRPDLDPNSDENRSKIGSPGPAPDMELEAKRRSGTGTRLPDTHSKS